MRCTCLVLGFGPCYSGVHAIGVLCHTENTVSRTNFVFYNDFEKNKKSTNLA